ncbi:MAG: MFS transporter [Amphritea sp.]
MTDTVGIAMTDSLEQTEHFGRKSVWAGIVLGSFVLMVFLIQPLLIGALAGQGFSEADLGLLAASDLLGMAIASVLGLFWVKRLPWRPVALVGLLAVIGGNLLCIGQNDFASLIALRLLAGLGAGSVVVLTFSIIARTSHPDRYTSFFIAFEVFSQAIAFTLMANIVTTQGINSLYYLFAGLAAVGVLLVAFVPHSGASEALDESGSAVTEPVGRSVLLLILAAMAIFFLAQSALWAFSERIGADAGLDAESIGNVLAITSLFAVAGALLAGWLDLRFGRVLPIAIAAIAQIVLLALFQGEMSLVHYAIVFGLFGFFWNLGIPYQVGVLVSHDKELRFAALIPAFQGIGLALGPAMAGAFLGDGSYLPVNIIAGAALLLYLVMIIPFARSSR